jgi:hypothetical protein
VPSPRITVACGVPATAPPNSPAGYLPATVPVTALITVSVRIVPDGLAMPTVTTPCHARTDMIFEPAGSSSVNCHSGAPSDSR